MGETSVTVAWEADTTIEHDVDFQGYNVYVSADSNELLVQSGENLNKINPETIEDTIYEVRNLSQDTVFYFQVRTVNTEDKVGDYNDDVPFIAASPRPEFTVMLYADINLPAIDDSCAIRFSDATIMADSAMANGGADMWLQLWGMLPGDSVSFNSPELHPQYGQNTRSTKFDNLGQFGFDDINEVMADPVLDYVVISAGDLVIAETQDGHYVKIHVDTIDSSMATITYAYQNIAGFPGF
jgi:hypothetical protein